MPTPRQIRANRQNGRKGGPRTAQGKAVSRMNARKHGIFSVATTEFDDDEIKAVHQELLDWAHPVGAVEKILVEKLAHTYLRLQRCARAEAELHIQTWQPRRDNSYAMEKHEERIREGLHASWFHESTFRRSVELMARYDKTLTNQFLQLLHDLERLQRLRLGEDVQPPLVVQVDERNESTVPGR
jgi:hypothetical protein